MENQIKVWFVIVLLVFFLFGCNTDESSTEIEDPVLQPEDVFPQDVLNRIRSDYNIRDNQLEITYISNHGYLFSTETNKILIDSLTECGGGYTRTSRVILAMFNNGEFPFNNIDLSLTTHSHGDHFDAECAVDFLIANSQTIHLSTEEVAGLIANQANSSQVGNRSMGSSPELGTREQINIAGIAMEVFRVDHHGIYNDGYEHVVFMFTLNGIKILHVGDACKLMVQYENFGLENEEIDIMIAPFGSDDCSDWCFIWEEQNAFNVIRNYIKPKHIILSHFAFNVTDAEINERRSTVEENLPGISLSVFHPTILNQKIYTKENNKIQVITKPIQ